MTPDRILYSTFSLQHFYSAAIPSALEVPLKRISDSKIAKIVYPALVAMQSRLTSRCFAEVVYGIVVVRLFSNSKQLAVILDPSSLFNPIRLVMTISLFGVGFFLPYVANRYGHFVLAKWIDETVFHKVINNVVKVVNTIATLILIGVGISVLCGNGFAIIPACLLILNVVSLALIWIPAFISNKEKSKVEIPKKFEEYIIWN